MSLPSYNVRRCAPCDADWPGNSTYNLCPRCQRNTYASTSSERPDIVDSAQALARYNTIREFDAKADATPWEFATTDMSSFEDAIEKTPSVLPTNYGLAGDNPQAVNYRRPPLHGATDA